MAVSLKITRLLTELPTEGYIPTGYPVKFLAEGTDIPSEIFVFKSLGNGKDCIFSNVAALYEMGDLITETYMLENNELDVPYFRVSEVTLVLPSIEVIEEVTLGIQQDAERLVEDYKSLENFTFDQEIVIS